MRGYRRRLTRRDLSLTEAEIRATEQAAALRESDTSVPEASETLARLLLRHEGIASSGIEGLREPLVSVLIAERTGEGGAAGWLADNLAVIRVAHEAAHEQLSADTLHEWHERLMRNRDLAPLFYGSQAETLTLTIADRPATAGPSPLRPPITESPR